MRGRSVTGRPEKTEVKRFYMPAAVAALLLGFWLSPQFQQIAAGVAIFLFGMLMLEDGFRDMSGGLLERILERATRSFGRALAFGVIVTSALQSSSLVSILTIAFLSTGLLSLSAGIAIVFGANLGTTTGAWLIAGVGLKVDIAAYAMPMIALGILLVFQTPRYLRGIGHALGGLGFLFLGISFMIAGFEAVRDHVEPSRYALDGVAGLAVYTVLGAAATVVMQSSHATMVLVITALASGHLGYDNAIALAIGANIGTTVTAMIGAVSANFQGRRLAFAHLIFNGSTGLVALAFLVPLRALVDTLSAGLGIAADDFALKLAVFHTVFNVLGIILMLPVRHRLERELRRRIPEPVREISHPRYLNDAVDAFPETLESALQKEVVHLYDNAAELILKGLNLRPERVYAATDFAALMRDSRQPLDLDFDDLYERRVKPLHAAIVAFATRIGEREIPADVMLRVYALRDTAGDVVRAAKAVKHLRKNVNRFTVRPHGVVTEIYDGLRAEIAQTAAQIRHLSRVDPDERSALWLDHESARAAAEARDTTRAVDLLIREGRISAEAATSFLNDSHYAFGAIDDLIDVARVCFPAPERAVADVESLLALDEDDIRNLAEADEGGSREVSRNGYIGRTD